MSRRRRRPTSIRHGCAVALLAVLVVACGDTGGLDERPRVEALGLAALPGSAEPNLATGPAGELVLSWQEPAGNETALRFASFDGDSWSEARTAATGDRWFVNWADFPSVVPVDGDFWAAHWLARRDGGTYPYDVAVAISTDGGASWSRARGSRRVRWSSRSAKPGPKPWSSR